MGEWERARETERERGMKQMMMKQLPCFSSYDTAAALDLHVNTDFPFLYSAFISAVVYSGCLMKWLFSCARRHFHD